MKIGFIGAGKVGFSLGKYLKTHGVNVVGYYSKTPESAKSAADFTETKVYDAIADIVQESDTLFVTVPDGQICMVWDSIKNLDIKNKNICHCSGSISSAAFFDGEKLGASVYSVHPLYAVSSKYDTYKELGQAYFTLEGSADHLQEMKDMLQGAGCKVIVMDSENKSLYHCGAVVVSNLVTGLYSLGVHILENCGFEEKDAQKALIPLFLGNVTTIEKHIQSIQNISDAKAGADLMKIYLLLSEQLLAIAGEKHPERDYVNVAEVIDDEKHSIHI